MCATRPNRIIQSLEALESRRLFAAGDLDALFGSGGVVLRDVLHGDDYGFAVTVQADGKVLIAGRADIGGLAGSDFAVARFNADGTPDSSFGTGGLVTTDLGSPSDSACCIAVQSDGKIVLAGETTRSSTGTDFALVRYNSNGTLDSSFGTGGKVVNDLSGSTDQPKAMALGTNGTIIVAGSADIAGLPQFVVARYTSTGQLDGGFGAGGVSKTSFTAGYSQARALTVLNDGSIVVAGMASNFSDGINNFAAVHYFANGAFDSSFGSSGWAIVSLGGDNQAADSVVLQSDGKLVLAGEYYNSTTDAADFALTRLTSSGALDTSFGNSGTVLTDFNGGYDQSFAAAVQSDDRIVVAGIATLNGHSTFGVATYNRDGSPDTAFAGGHVAVPIGTDAVANAVALDGQGHIYLGGFALNASGNYDLALARVMAHLNVAPTANAGGGYTVDSGGAVTLNGSASSDPDGQVVSYQWDFNYDGQNFQTDATGVTTTFSAAGLTGPLTRIIALRVTDNDGAANIVTTTVTINPPPPPPPSPTPGSLPSGVAQIQNDPAQPGKQILFVYGTAGNDVIRLRGVRCGKVEVRLNTKWLGTFANVSRIVAYGQDGNDLLDAHSSPVPVALFGGAGNDRLWGSRFNDILVGGDGNDRLHGFCGKDLLIGGAGADDLHGLFGQDILVGASTAFDNNLDALQSILNEWIRPDRTYAQRVTDLTTGGGLNGSNTLSGTNVIDDQARDMFHGTGKLDLLISGAGDKGNMLRCLGLGKSKR